MLLKTESNITQYYLDNKLQKRTNINSKKGIIPTFGQDLYLFILFIIMRFFITIMY
jgi:hypothetical protein